jgi:hypothetical protein
LSENPINITAPGNPVADGWVDRGPTDSVSAPIAVQANKPYYLLVEYYESGGGALSEAQWGADASSLEDIPTDALKTYYIKAGDNSGGRLTGQVVSADGSPAAGVNVTLTDAAGVANSFTTNAGGVYSALLGPGAYTISASGPTSSGIKGTGSITTPTSVTGGQGTTAPKLTLTPITLPALPAPVDKVVYYDEGNTFAWINQISAGKIKDYLSGKGYTVVDAAGLQTFMQSHVTSKTPSVVVMANDIFPDTVVDVSSGVVVNTGNLVVDYLNAGGRVVYSGDIPFYNISESGTNYTPGDAGASTILGFNTSSTPRDLNDKPVLTPAAQSMGVTDTWQASQRPMLASQADVVLATGQGGTAPGWIRFFPQGTGPGAFIRWVDTTEDDAAHVIDDNNILADIQKLAEFSGNIGGGGTTTPTLGDLNGDGKVNVQDATLSLRIAVGSVTPTDAQKTAGDVNHDGKWNVQDTTLILRFAVGAITAFP